MDKQIFKEIERNISSPKMSNQKSTEIIYLELDINQTEKRFRQYAKDYNAELHNPEFIKEQYPVHLKNKVQVQQTRKSLTIKSNTITVAIAIIKAYFNHLKLIERGKIVKDPKFTMNNVAIATMTGMSDRSVRRHVNKLLATGFLQEKIFRGTNASFILKINPEFLVARPERKLTDILINQHIEKHPGMPINPITYKYYNSLRPSFTDHPSGILRSVCPNIEINPDTFNNNILSKGIVDNSLHTKSKRPHKLTVINNEINNPAKSGNPDDKKPEQTNVRHQKEKNQSYQQKLQRESHKNIPAKVFPLIFTFTELAWNFALSVLYSNRPMSPDQVQLAKHYISLFFLDHVKHKDPRTLSQSYDEFTTTIQIMDDYRNRKIEWNLARPEYLFNPKFGGGFYKAHENWLPNHKDKQKHNKDWNKHKMMVGKLFRYYSADPTFESYRQCSQRLGKLKNKKFLDTFNSCVLDKDKYNNQFMNQQN